jgi:uncharacterized membrane protein
VRPLAVVLLGLTLFGCARKPVSFHEQIQPILNSRCTKCHGTEARYGKIVLTSYDSLMYSRTISGKEPLAIAGSPAQSRMYILCATKQSHFRMPPDTSNVTPLPPSEMELLGKWISQGMKNN